MTRKLKIILSIVAVCLILVLAGAGIGYYLFLAPQFMPGEKTYVYIDRDDTADSVFHKVSTAGHARQLIGWKLMARYRHYDEHIRTGRYVIHPEDDVYHVFSRLYRGYQSPISITIGSFRTMDRMARTVGHRLMIDSTEIASLLHDTLYMSRLGYTPETLPCLFIPETYEVFWNISAEQFIARMQQEHTRFWTADRLSKAQALNMTPEEVCTLASIVEEETNNQAEKPMVAGLYLNRLRIDMPLQADPTVKFALQDFELRRITNAHLNVDSPYNTYKNAGLPPGPIRIATPAGIDAVLNHTKHNYIYMCAKEDFSGTHNFAVSYSEHVRNAQKYWRALNQRKIYK